MEFTQVLDFSFDDSDNVNESKVEAVLKIDGISYDIKTGENIIGRDANLSSIVLNFQSVSGEHAKIDASSNGHFICDLGSRNKTRWKKKILRPYVQYNLEDGDRIFFADKEATYHIVATQDAKDENVSNLETSYDVIPETPAGTSKKATNPSSIVLESPSSSDSGPDDSFVLSSQPVGNSVLPHSFASGIADSNNKACSSSTLVAIPEKPSLESSVISLQSNANESQASFKLMLSETITGDESLPRDVGGDSPTPKQPDGSTPEPSNRSETCGTDMGIVINETLEESRLENSADKEIPSSVGKSPAEENVRTGDSNRCQGTVRNGHEVEAQPEVPTEQESGSSCLNRDGANAEDNVEVGQHAFGNDSIYEAETQIFDLPEFNVSRIEPATKEDDGENQSGLERPALNNSIYEAETQAFIIPECENAASIVHDTSTKKADESIYEAETQLLTERPQSRRIADEDEGMHQASEDVYLAEMQAFSFSLPTRVQRRRSNDAKESSASAVREDEICEAETQLLTDRPQSRSSAETEAFSFSVPSGVQRRGSDDAKESSASAIRNDEIYEAETRLLTDRTSTNKEGDLDESIYDAETQVLELPKNIGKDRQGRCRPGNQRLGSIAENEGTREMRLAVEDRTEEKHLPEHPQSTVNETSIVEGADNHVIAQNVETSAPEEAAQTNTIPEGKSFGEARSDQLPPEDENAPICQREDRSEAGTSATSSVEGNEKSSAPKDSESVTVSETPKQDVSVLSVTAGEETDSAKESSTGVEKPVVAASTSISVVVEEPEAKKADIDSDSDITDEEDIFSASTQMLSRGEKAQDSPLDGQNRNKQGDESPRTEGDLASSPAKTVSGSSKSTSSLVGRAGQKDPSRDSDDVTVEKDSLVSVTHLTSSDKPKRRSASSGIEEDAAGEGKAEGKVEDASSGREVKEHIFSCPTQPIPPRERAVDRNQEKTAGGGNASDEVDQEDIFSCATQIVPSVHTTNDKVEKMAVAAREDSSDAEDISSCATQIIPTEQAESGDNDGAARRNDNAESSDATDEENIFSCATQLISPKRWKEEDKEKLKSSRKEGAASSEDDSNRSIGKVRKKRLTKRRAPASPFEEDKEEVPRKDKTQPESSKTGSAQDNCENESTSGPFRVKPRSSVTSRTSIDNKISVSKGDEDHAVATGSDDTDVDDIFSCSTQKLMPRFNEGDSDTTSAGRPTPEKAQPSHRNSEGDLKDDIFSCATQVIPCDTDRPKQSDGGDQKRKETKVDEASSDDTDVDDIFSCATQKLMPRFNGGDSDTTSDGKPSPQKAQPSHTDNVGDLKDNDICSCATQVMPCDIERPKQSDGGEQKRKESKGEEASSDDTDVDDIFCCATQKVPLTLEKDTENKINTKEDRGKKSGSKNASTDSEETDDENLLSHLKPTIVISAHDKEKDQSNVVGGPKASSSAIDALSNDNSNESETLLKNYEEEPSEEPLSDSDDIDAPVLPEGAPKKTTEMPDNIYSEEPLEDCPVPETSNLLQDLQKDLNCATNIQTLPTGPSLDHDVLSVSRQEDETERCDPGDGQANAQSKAVGIVEGEKEDDQKGAGKDGVNTKPKSSTGQSAPSDSNIASRKIVTLQTSSDEKRGGSDTDGQPNADSDGVVGKKTRTSTNRLSRKARNDPSTSDRPKNDLQASSAKGRAVRKRGGSQNGPETTTEEASGGVKKNDPVVHRKETSLHQPAEDIFDAETQIIPCEIETADPSTSVRPKNDLQVSSAKGRVVRKRGGSQKGPETTTEESSVGVKENDPVLHHEETALNQSTEDIFDAETQIIPNEIETTDSKRDEKCEDVETLAEDRNENVRLVSEQKDKVVRTDDFIRDVDDGSSVAKEASVLKETHTKISSSAISNDNASTLETASNRPRTRKSRLTVSSTLRRDPVSSVEAGPSKDVKQNKTSVADPERLNEADVSGQKEESELMAQPKISDAKIHADEDGAISVLNVQKARQRTSGKAESTVDPTSSESNKATPGDVLETKTSGKRPFLETEEDTLLNDKTEKSLTPKSKRRKGRNGEESSTKPESNSDSRSESSQGSRTRKKAIPPAASKAEEIHSSPKKEENLKSNSMAKTSNKPLLEEIGGDSCGEMNKEENLLPTSTRRKTRNVKESTSKAEVDSDNHSENSRDSRSGKQVTPSVNSQAEQIQNAAKNVVFGNLKSKLETKLLSKQFLQEATGDSSQATNEEENRAARSTRQKVRNESESSSKAEDDLDTHSETGRDSRSRRRMAPPVDPLDKQIGDSPRKEEHTKSKSSTKHSRRKLVEETKGDSSRATSEEGNLTPRSKRRKTRSDDEAKEDSSQPTSEEGNLTPRSKRRKTRSDEELSSIAENDDGVLSQTSRTSQSRRQKSLSVDSRVEQVHESPRKEEHVKSKPETKPSNRQRLQATKGDSSQETSEEGNRTSTSRSRKTRNEIESSSKPENEPDTLAEITHKSPSRKRKSPSQNVVSGPSKGEELSKKSKRGDFETKALSEEKTGDESSKHQASKIDEPSQTRTSGRTSRIHAINEVKDNIPNEKEGSLPKKARGSTTSLTEESNKEEQAPTREKKSARGTRGPNKAEGRRSSQRSSVDSLRTVETDEQDLAESGRRSGRARKPTWKVQGADEGLKKTLVLSHSQGSDKQSEDEAEDEKEAEDAFKSVAPKKSGRGLKVRISLGKETTQAEPDNLVSSKTESVTELQEAEGTSESVAPKKSGRGLKVRISLGKETTQAEPDNLVSSKTESVAELQEAEGTSESVAPKKSGRGLKVRISLGKETTQAEPDNTLSIVSSKTESVEAASTSKLRETKTKPQRASVARSSRREGNIETAPPEEQAKQDDDAPSRGRRIGRSFGFKEPTSPVSKKTRPSSIEPSSNAFSETSQIRTETVIDKPVRGGRRKTKDTAPLVASPSKTTAAASFSELDVTKADERRSLRGASKTKGSFGSASDSGGSKEDLSGGLNRSSSFESHVSSSSAQSPRSARRSIQKQTQRVLFTGYSDPELEKAVKHLGGSVVENIDTATVAVTDKLRRTVKLLSMLGRGLPVVNPAWLTASKKSGSFLDPWNFLLDDTEAESKFSFNMEESLRMAASRKLLDGYTIFVTKTVSPPPDAMKDIVNSCGGVVVKRAPKVWPEKSIIISCPDDAPVVKKLPKHPPLVAAEWLLSGVLQQKLDTDKHKLIL